MIRLIGVLSEGGVPVHMKSRVGTEGEMILGPLIEASKSLSAMMGSGEVRKLAFQDNTMIVTETRKKYTIVALVNRAEDYMDSLLRIISGEIDSSPIAVADGSVTNDHRDIVEGIIDAYVKDTIEISFPDTISSIWDPILRAIKENHSFNEITEEVDFLLSKSTSEEQWNAFKDGINTSLSDALVYALRGAFDYACAASIEIEDTVARLFSLKMGALTLSMSKTQSPPLSTLKELANKLPSQHPLTNLAQTLVGFVAGEVIPADYSRAFREATSRFDFVDDDEHLLLGFLFLDPRVVDYSDFAEGLHGLYCNTSELVCSYIRSIEERGKIFEKLYSITSYEAFRDELGQYKGSISNILGNIDKVLMPELESELREGRGLEIGINASLRIQNYIALLTALSESPIMSINERKETLEEVLKLYQDYFRELMRTHIPIFAFTLDSVFQSLSVALAEYYFIATGKEREQHITQIIAFLADIFDTVKAEWPKRRVRFSLFVMGNALFPVLSRANILHEEEIRLIYLAMQLLDMNTIDAIQITRPSDFATNLGNAVTSLAAIGARVLPETIRPEVLQTCVLTSLEVQAWFISNGVVCRDDIISTTFHMSLITDQVPKDTLSKIVNQVIALNSVAIQDIEKYDYEVAMMASPLIDVLATTGKRLENEYYHRLARQYFDAALTAWAKYGFHQKAENFRKKFTHLVY